MDDRERILHAIQFYKKTNGREQESFRKMQKMIIDDLEEMTSANEKVNYLKSALAGATEAKLRVTTANERESPELVGDEFHFFPEEESMKELIEFIENQLKEYQKIVDLLGEPENNSGIEETTTKQQILLLHSLGILDYEGIKDLPNTKKAKLFSALLNRSENSIRELLTYINGKKDIEPENNSGIEETTTKQQILLLHSLGILDYEGIKDLPNTKKAKLFSALLNRSENSIRELLTYINGKKDIEPENNSGIEETTTKQQILLLHSLGILDYEGIKDLPNTKKAKLFSALLNRSENSIRELLTYINGKKDIEPENNCRTEPNIKKINELLTSVGLNKMIIK